MKVRLPLMIQDPMTALEWLEDPKIVEAMHLIVADDGLSDGPTSPRVAVVDIDPRTGQRRAGARFEPPNRSRKMGRYIVHEPQDLYSPEFIQISVFAAIMKTIRTIGAEDVLGRPLKWGFDGEQLQVIPSAGEWANAYYDRADRSLRFFSFPDPRNRTRTIHTALSRDIVSHETGHAIVDGIAPALYDAVSPQSLAIHETMADLTALFTAFRSNNLCRQVLEHTNGSLRDSTAFSSLAPEVGRALDASGRRRALRSLWNDKTLDPEDLTLDAFGAPNRVTSQDPHDLSEVLSGALYRLMVHMYETSWRYYREDFSRSGYVLAMTAKRFQRLVYRALDFLPPGDASFADFARALVAGECSSTPETVGCFEHEGWFATELVRRGIIHEAGGLEDIGRQTSSQPMKFDPGPWPWTERIRALIERSFSLRRVRVRDIWRLAEDDVYAHRFVREHRELLRVPVGARGRLVDRFMTDIYFREGDLSTRKIEVILKVAWDAIEPNPPHPSLPPWRAVSGGTTLALNPDTRGIEAVVSTHLEAHRDSRDQFLLSLVAAGPYGAEASHLDPATQWMTTNGVLRMRGAGSLLHMVGREPFSPGREERTPIGGPSPIPETP